MAPVFESAPNDPTAPELGILGTREQILAVCLLQERLASWRARRRQAEAQRAEAERAEALCGASAKVVQAAARGRSARVALPQRRESAAPDNKMDLRQAGVEAEVVQQQGGAAAVIQRASRVRARATAGAAVLLQASVRGSAARRRSERGEEEEAEQAEKAAEAAPKEEAEAVAAGGTVPAAAAAAGLAEVAAREWESSEGSDEGREARGACGGGAAGADPDGGGSAAAAAAAAEAAEERESFVMRNLDTGEAVVLDVPRGRAEEEEGRERASAALSSLITNSGEWEAIKREARGVLEKLASAKTLSFRSYQLCVWQERWVYAADDALCYQHLNSEVEPIGAAKRIPYSSVEFVGPFDETQFVIKCAGRAFTFLCETTEQRTKWIKNIAALSGCSSSTEVCFKSQTMGH